MIHELRRSLNKVGIVWCRVNFPHFSLLNFEIKLMPRIKDLSPIAQSVAFADSRTRGHWFDPRLG